jgi:2'-5' RNA ligase
MGIRSFLAFELPTQLKTPLARTVEGMRNYRLEVRWVKVENIHLTLVFLGNVAVEAVRSIGQLAEPVCQQYGPFSLRVEGIGMFGTMRRPRVLWAGIAGDVDRMADFRNDLVHNLLPLGIKQEDRAFRPHLTLGRFRKGAGASTSLREAMTAHGGIGTPDCVADELVLFRSDLKPSGAVYSRLDAWSLTGAR